jgi:prevent-host-death family protein
MPLLDSYKKAIKIAISYVEGMKMKVANTVELKNKTNKILREVMKGQPVIITYRGKPAASLTPLSDEDLEDFILENSPKIRKMISEAVKDVKDGKLTSLEEYLKVS